MGFLERIGLTRFSEKRKVKRFKKELMSSPFIERTSAKWRDSSAPGYTNFHNSPNRDVLIRGEKNLQK